MKAHFKMFAAYNRWANARLYAAVFALPDEVYRRDISLFFGSIHGTLNHLLLTDRLWMGRIDRSEDVPEPLDLILHDDRCELLGARIEADARLTALVDSISADGFAAEHRYLRRGEAFTQPLGQMFAHLFNHQTHHRGQAHSGLSMLGAVPPSLDLLQFQRGAPAPDPSELFHGG